MAGVKEIRFLCEHIIDGRASERTGRMIGGNYDLFCTKNVSDRSGSGKEDEEKNFRVKFFWQPFFYRCCITF